MTTKKGRCILVKKKTRQRQTQVHQCINFNSPKYKIWICILLFFSGCTHSGQTTVISNPDTAQLVKLWLIIKSCCCCKETWKSSFSLTRSDRPSLSHKPLPLPSQSDNTPLSPWEPKLDDHNGLRRADRNSGEKTKQEPTHERPVRGVAPRSCTVSIHGYSGLEDMSPAAVCVCVCEWRFSRSAAVASCPSWWKKFLSISLLVFSLFTVHCCSHSSFRLTLTFPSDLLCYCDRLCAGNGLRPGCGGVRPHCSETFYLARELIKCFQKSPS